VKLGTDLFSWPTGLNDQVGSNGKAAYKFGNDAQKEAFKELFGAPKALINPDRLMDLVC
jgi:hypothetical protein